MDSTSPPAIAPEPQNEGDSDAAATLAPETRVDGQVDASTQGKWTIKTFPGEFDFGAWRWLSRGRDRLGRKRFQKALGSGQQRIWRGKIITIGDNSTSYIKERNERESNEQEQRREAVRLARQRGDDGNA